jgi:hypothetical protein
MATDDALSPVSADATASDLQRRVSDFDEETPTLPIQFEPMAVTDERCRTGRAGMEELDAVSAAADMRPTGAASAAVDKQPTAMLFATSQEDAGAKVS